jgi:hypothetical protein
MRRRWVKALTITVAVLAVLFVAADRLGVWVAEDYVANKAKQEYGFGNEADSYTHASIGGFPFLTQLATRDFDDVTLTVGNITADPDRQTAGGYLHIGTVRLSMRDLRVDAGLDGAEARTVTGTVTVSYRHLADAVARTVSHGGLLTLSAAPGAASPAAVRVRGTADGRPFSAIGTVEVAGDAVKVTMPGAAVQDPEWILGLPPGMRFAGVRTTADGVEMSLVGHQVVIGGATPLVRPDTGR